MPKNSKEYNNKNYEKYWGTADRVAYRSRLNKINRDKGNYGNGDGKDEHHISGRPEGSNTKKISQESNRKMGALKAIKHRKAKMARGGKY